MPTPRVKKVLKRAKGFYSRAKNCYRIAKPRVDKALEYAYVGRKLKKRDARTDWIRSINAATRQHGVRYSSLIGALHTEETNVEINRKMLAELAKYEPRSFESVLKLCLENGTLQCTDHGLIQHGIDHGLEKTTFIPSDIANIRIKESDEPTDEQFFLDKYSKEE